MEEITEETFISHQNQIRTDLDETRKKGPSPLIKFYRSKSTRGLLAVIIFAAVIPILIYYLVININFEIKEESIHTCVVNKTYRVTCGRSNATLKYCDQINCCFDNETSTCFHYLPSKYYFSVVNSKYVPSLPQSPYGSQSYKEAALTINELDENRLKITLHDPAVTINKTSQMKDKSYSYNLPNDTLYVEVFRNDTQDVILTTNKGPLIISENYWEWSVQLTEEFLFGLGETLIQLDVNSTLTKVIYGNQKDHNTLPIFMGYKKGNFHGLLIRHYGPLEVTVLPSNLISLKFLVGNLIELELCTGPTIKDVMEQQGTNQMKLPEPWMLGVHVCREGETLDLSEMISEYKNLEKGFQYDSDCIHQNLFMALLDDSQVWNDSLITDLQAADKKFILSLSPHIPVNSSLYKNVINLDSFYKINSSNFEGKYLNRSVIYPDFESNVITDYIQTLLDELDVYFNLTSIPLILNDNWPSETTYRIDQEPKDFLYMSLKIKEAMSFTIPWNAVDNNNVTHIMTHNNYGNLQLQALQQQVPEIIMTASHDFETTTPVLVQSLNISWTNLKKSVRTILSNGLFGYPLTSIPVCGSTASYNESLHESLCLRWYLMASTSPLFRISSDLPRRDPDSMTSLFVKDIINEAINLRYMLIPYFRTVLSHNEPLMRPVFYDFPSDTNTFSLDEQYMVGSQLMVVHPMTSAARNLKVYLPPDGGFWYEFNGGLAYNSTNNTYLVLDIVESDWIAFIPEGSIIPLRTVAKETLGQIFYLQLVIALKQNNSTFTASGSMILDTVEEYIYFSATENDITISGFTEEVKIGLGCDQGVVVLQQVNLYSTSGPVFYYPNIDIQCNSLDGNYTGSLSEFNTYL